MTQKKHLNLLESGKINISNFIKVCWMWKYHVFLIVLIFSTISVSYSFTIQNKYTSIAILKEKNQNNNLQGLGTIGRLGFGGSVSESKTDLAIAVIKSRAFVEELAKDSYIKSSIYAANSFDPSTKKIIYNQNIFLEATNSWNKNRYPHPSGPSYIDVHKKYLKSLRISKDNLTGFVTISYEHVSPIFAFEFLNIIISNVNQLIKENDLSEAELAKSFLYEELDNTSSTYVNDAISELIKSQLETQVKAKASKNYVFDMIDKPFIPIKRSKPSRSVALAFGLFLGLLASLVYILLSNEKLKSRIHESEY